MGGWAGLKRIKLMDRNSFIMSFHYVYIVVQGIVTLNIYNKLITKLFNLFGLILNTKGSVDERKQVIFAPFQHGSHIIISKHFFSININ